MNAEQLEAAVVETVIQHQLSDLGATEVSREYAVDEDDALKVQIRAVIPPPIDTIKVKLIVEGQEWSP